VWDDHRSVIILLSYDDASRAGIRAVCASVEEGQLVEHAGYARPADRRVDHQRQRLARNIVHHREDPEPDSYLRSGSSSLLHVTQAGVDLKRVSVQLHLLRHRGRRVVAALGGSDVHRENRWIHRSTTLRRGRPVPKFVSISCASCRLARVGLLQTADETSGTLDALLDDLFRLHAARWSGRGVLRGLELFHSDVARGFLRERMLRMLVLRLDGRSIAALYAFATRDRTWFYLGGFDPRFEKLSPGTVAVGTAIERAVGEGHRAFDFLRGAEPYKYWWGARNTVTSRRSVVFG